MKRQVFTLTIFFLILCISVSAQTGDTLKSEIENILATKRADVGVSILNLKTGEWTSIQGDMPYPMISVFKFHVALTVMHQVDEGKLSLDQQLFIKKQDLLPDTYSPFRDKHPEGNLNITLREAIGWMIKVSDNNLCDFLIRLVGGVKTIDRFINNSHFVIKNDEAGMHENWDAQFLNTTTPDFATDLLRLFYEGKLLSPSATHFLYTTMVATSVGENRIKGQLPRGTVVAHRIGSSFTNAEGLTGSINDIGIIELPDGNRLVLSVFVHNTTEHYKDGEAIIASIAKAVWDYYTK